MSAIRLSNPFQYWGSPASMRSVESALRAMWVSTCPTVQPGSPVGVDGSTGVIDGEIRLQALLRGVERIDRAPDVFGFEPAVIAHEPRP